jgi:hypothetical protein
VRTAYLSALSTPTIAILGALIAYRQWCLAQNKLKLDLFDRRFSVYESARNFLASIMTSGRANEKELLKFLAGTREAKWLLNRQVADYLVKEIYHKALDLQTLESELQGVGLGPERTANVRKQSELKKCLMAQYEVLDQHFSPYLQLSH